VNTSDDGKEDDAAIKGSKSAKIAVFRSRVGGQSKQNLFYNPPVYAEINELSDDQIVLRMNFLAFQTRVLGEAAEFECVQSTKATLEAAVSSCKAERNALGEYLQKTIVEVDLKRARISAQEYRTSLIAQQRNRSERASAVVHAKKSGRRSSSKNAHHPRGVSNSLVWDGVERRRGQPSLLHPANREVANHKSKSRSRTIHISLHL